MLRPEASTNTPNEDYSSDMFYMPKFTAPARELLRPPKSAVPHFELFVRFREVRSKAKRYDTDRYRRSSGAASTDRPSPKPERRRPVGRGDASLVVPIFSRGRRLTLNSSEGQDRKSWIAPCVPT